MSPSMATTETTLSSSSIVKHETIKKAVEAIQKWKHTKSQSSNPQLLPQDDFVYLVLTLKKIPAKGRTKPYKIPVPTPLHGPGSEICLVFDDRSKSNLEKKDAKAKLEADDLTGFVTKLLRLSKLKSDYRPFEAKRKLCDSYDMFLADQRLIPMLPKLLGKHFFEKKKIPVPVNLMHKNWKEQVERVCGSALLYLKTGTCSVIKVARGSMETDEIVNNVAAAIEGAVAIVEKNWANVRSLHLKLSESVALPVYQALPEIKLRIDGAEEERQKVEKSEKTSEGKKDEKSGKKVSKKGRIREVRYMDNKVDEDDELATDCMLTESDKLESYTKNKDVDDDDLMEGVKYSKLSRDYVLDEDDYDLLTENLKVEKKKKKKESKKEEAVSEISGKKRSKKSVESKKSVSAKRKIEKGGEESAEKKKKTAVMKSKSPEAKVQGKKRKSVAEE